MYITAAFIGSDSSFHLIDTDKLEQKLKDEIEKKIKKDGSSSFNGEKYFKNIQNGIVMEKVEFPVSIHGMIKVYAD